LTGFEAETQGQGQLPSLIMARTFSFLRVEYLVLWSCIKSYMLAGDTPPGL